MKRALSVTAVTALSLLVFLFVGYAQEEGATVVSSLLEQELAAMEAAFGGLEAFMGELVGEVKGNMGDIYDFNAKVDDLRDIVTAVSIEIKEAEGLIIGLREDVDGLSTVQQELRVRVVALEAGLSELSAFCEDLRARLDITTSDLYALRESFDLWAADYSTFKNEFYDFRETVLAEIDSLEAGLTAEIDALGAGLSAEIGALRDSVYTDMTIMQSYMDELAIRVQALEDEDVGTFKNKVIELERQMAALSIRVDNNRSKLEGFDAAFAAMSEDMATMQAGIIESNQELLGTYEARLQALEDNADLKAQIDTLTFVSIVALLAGVGALIWGFLGNS